MPIMSYLAYPSPGKREDLVRELNRIANCEVISSDNQDVLVLVTDTADPVAEEALQEKLNSIEEIECLAMVSGFSDETELETELQER